MKEMIVNHCKVTVDGTQVKIDAMYEGQVLTQTQMLDRMMAVAKYVLTEGFVEVKIGNQNNE